jgi:multidrug transporter EmrE-like cation transporter
MWFLLMVIILLTNGMSAFGLKVIAGWALPAAVKFPYLTVWYAGGFACIAIPMLLKRTEASWKEVAWGAALAALSIGGQVAMAVALDLRVPGHVVFTVAIGGSILVVAVAGRFLFGERMSRLSTAGVVLGFIAVVLLSVS